MKSNFGDQMHVENGKCDSSVCSSSLGKWSHQRVYKRLNLVWWSLGRCSNCSISTWRNYPFKMGVSSILGFSVVRVTTIYRTPQMENHGDVFAANIFHFKLDIYLWQHGPRTKAPSKGVRERERIESMVENTKVSNCEYFVKSTTNTMSLPPRWLSRQLQLQ